MIKNITIVSCHSREGGNLDTCFRRYDTKFVSPNSIGFTIEVNVLWLNTNQVSSKMSESGEIFPDNSNPLSVDVESKLTVCSSDS
ncbi:hypothetical protein [Candidatus Tisiphia endosymbiont of Hybos culiciformis]|uniref:hypothetical protein n=1 Tax=Candidatus Tisiphia endosymbiont of Hybos culiciformis TaxID=3139331 RepID=UPI003CCAB4FE